ncbi:hypothetical protein UFOVP256_61 [uncultured Caudovirales phage]|uniref:Uncharacterized protein n=1 Tax=uncultured Caudovirales phage TaxID=2100421 RepID=A0A6J5LH97_9CAUD|nr:hypothetical protein UFOVP256_61 [uncultured Caudovirales phage]
MPGFFKSLGQLFTGTPEKRENVSTLRPEQEGLYQQLVNSGRGQGAGGAFGGASDYYRSLLGDNSSDYNSFAAPALRQYNQDIVPNISEQFAQMGGSGQGALSSSGFRNAQIQGATDLAERLGQIRANLRQAGAQGLQNIGQLGLQPFSQNMVTRQGAEGLLSNLAPAIGTGIGAAFGGPAGAGIGGGLGNLTGNWMKNSLGGNKVGANTIPDWQNAPASPTSSNGFNAPRFLQGQRGF